jgi:hypothetical protein
VTRRYFDIEEVGDFALVFGVPIVLKCRCENIVEGVGVVVRVEDE